MDFDAFRRFLRDELTWRQLLNPRLSLRAYARRLGTDHATLSQIIRGRRKLTPATARQLTGDLERRILAELAAPDFRPDARHLARALDAPVAAVQAALTRLLRAGALVMRSESTWTDLTKETST